jgi:hypothetical protein
MPEALGRIVAADCEYDSRLVERRIASGPACQPVEIKALVAVTECVEWIADPDSSTGRCDLL